MQEDMQKTMHKTSASPTPWEIIFPGVLKRIRNAEGLLNGSSLIGRQTSIVASILRGQYQAGEQSMHRNCALTPPKKQGKPKAKPWVQVSGGNDPHL